MAIDNVFNYIQTENLPVLWSQINSKSINEFQMAGYITIVFLTLYLTSYINLYME